uniref:C2H2-type domain-containing protein n=1 Tax=Setaria digitata TaxID=48799 RepID=A0A915Q394_9BILA
MFQDIFALKQFSPSMLRQLLSTANNVGSGNGSTDYENCSTHHLNSRNFDNSTVILAAPFIPPPSRPAAPPPLPLPPTPPLAPPAETTPTTSQNQFRADDNKNLSTLDYMSLAGYGMQTSMPSNPLGILDTNNDLNGTTELFSSTYAMLSADSTLSWNVWDEQTRFSSSTNDFAVQMNTDSHGFGYPVHTTSPSCSNIRYQVCNTAQIDNNYIANSQGLINGNRLELQHEVILPNNNDLGNVANSNYVQQEKCTGNMNQVAQSRLAGPSQGVTHTPVSTGEKAKKEKFLTGFGETVNGCESKQITCMACRGVYSSRRSLTGHIGRNEKCREIIGRNYLDQMGGFVENMRICESGNATASNGIDPVCPYCDRFISHYKGNIRRHVNQCMKSTRNGSKFRRKDTTLKQFSSETFQFGEGCSESTYSDSYQPHVLETPMSEKIVWMDSCGVVAEHNSIAKSKSYNMKKDRSNDDPFRCPLCDFATIYKGNMKRHLSTCHGLQDDDLKDGCIDKLKYKEAMDLRLENASRNKRSKNYLRVTPKLAQVDLDDGPSSSIADCSTVKISELTTDVTPSTFRIVSSFNNCNEHSSEEKLSLPVISSSDGIRAGTTESLSEIVETILSDKNQLTRSSAIDETIEAVIANGNENSLDQIGANSNVMV